MRGGLANFAWAPALVQETPVQDITFPTKCLGCKSQLLGVQRGLAYYDCDTYLLVDEERGMVTVKKSDRCDTIQRWRAACS
jgi:hypothetical protein